MDPNPPPRPLDTHFHLDLYPDPKGLLREMAERGCRGIAVTNAPFVFGHTMALAASYPGVEAAIGLHPELAVEREGELGSFRTLLPQTRFVGEVGLDYVSTDDRVRRVQRRVFGEILALCAAAGDKVLTVHSRRAATDVIAAVGPDFRGTVILHWFSGSQKELDRAQACGYYFSVNLAMTHSNSGQSLIRRMDASRVLTETDGPFLKIRDVPAKPWQAAESLPYLAEVWGCTTEDAARQVDDNYAAALGTIRPRA